MDKTKTREHLALCVKACYGGNIAAGVLHIGIGNFAMAHICDYVHKVLALGEANHGWGVLAVSLRSGTMLNALRRNGNKYTLVEKKSSSRWFRELAPIVDTLYAPENPERLIEQIANPAIKLVTMTITEKGYLLKNGILDLSNQDVVHDLSEPTVPRTVYYYLSKGLAARAAANSGPIVIMSLDNVEGNSSQLRLALLDFINQTNPGLKSWVEAHCDFPVTLVDRITPEVRDELRLESRKLLGYSPKLLIGTEEYCQLIIERTRFEMPPFETVGVKLVDSCADYWPRKFYMLNAVHQILGIVGMRMGIETIHHAMQNDHLAELAKLAHDEFRCFLAGTENELKEYSRIVLERFSDPSMNDGVVRVTKGTTIKLSQRVLTSIEKALASGGEIPSTAVFTAAAWALNLGGYDEFAQPIGYDDPEGACLGDIYAKFVEHLRVVMRCRNPTEKEELANETARTLLSAVGTRLGDRRFARFAANQSFVREFAHWLTVIEETGIVAAIQTLLQDKREKMTA